MLLRAFRVLRVVKGYLSLTALYRLHTVLLVQFRVTLGFGLPEPYHIVIRIGDIRFSLFRFALVAKLVCRSRII